MTTGFPRPIDDDSEDVVWGLTTGAALWKQGERYDAIVWLKRAVDAASHAGAGERADELNGAATQLMGVLASTPIPPRANVPTSGTAKPFAHLVKPPAPARAQASPSTSRVRASSDVARAQRGDGSDTQPGSEVGTAAEMPSVSTSAPPLAALTRAAVEDRTARHPSPPPTIVPDVELATIPPVSALPSIARGSPASDAAVFSTLERQLDAALRAIAGLSHEQRRALSDAANIERLSSGEEIVVSGIVMLLDGEASVGAAISDVTAAELGAGDVVLARGSIADAVPLRLVAHTKTAVVVTWDEGAKALWAAGAPELLGQWTRAADRLQAIAGSTIGAIGERLDAAMRSILFEALDARAFEPGVTVAHAGLPLPGFVVVGVGSLELDRDGETFEKLGPGDFLFATAILAGAPAPLRARAGEKGAVVLLGTRATTEDLLMNYPPLLEILGSV